MKTKIDKVPPWTKKRLLKRTSFDEGFKRLGTMNGFINPKEIKSKLKSPLIRK